MVMPAGVLCSPRNDELHKGTSQGNFSELTVGLCINACVIVLYDVIKQPLNVDLLVCK